MTKRNIKHRLLSLLTALAVALPMTFGAVIPALADASDTVAVKINGEAAETTVPAFADGDTVMLPVRSLMESRQWKVAWVETTQGAILAGGNKMALIYADKAYYDVNGVQKEAAAATRMYNDSLYFSADLAADILDLGYTYDPVMKVIDLGEDDGPSDGDSENSGAQRIIAYEDTYVQSGAADDNFGSAKLIELKGNTTGSTHRIIYLKFDLTGIKPESVGKATINMIGSKSNVEDSTNLQDYIFYEIDPNSWSEMTLTFNNRPELGKEIIRSNLIWSGSMSFDVTDYIAEQVAKGKRQISLALTGDPLTGKRVGYYSRESGNGPVLLVEESPENYHSDLPTMEGYGQGQNPWEWAEKLYAESQYVKTEPYETEHVKKTAAMIYRMSPSDDTYANSGNLAGQNFGNDVELMAKSGADNSNTTRKTFLKFKLNELPEGEILYSYLYMYTVGLENTNSYPIEIYLADSDNWSQNSLTWNNMPSQKGTALASVPVYQNNTWYSFDISDAVNEARTKGQSELSLVVVDTGTRHTHFASTRTANGPYMELCVNDGSRGTTTPSPGNDPEEYSITGTYVNKNNRSQTVSVPTRVLETVSGYTMTAAKPQLGQYGGRLDRQYEATGFYHAEKIDGRWWIIDPEGHPMINMGVAVITPTYGGQERLRQLMLSKFGSVEGWADATVDFLKNDLYFNGAGGWSNDKLLNAPQPFGFTEILYFMSRYMSSIGIGYIANGSSYFENGGLNVFDPDFVTFCDEFAAENVAPRKDLHNFMAWMADNELASDLTMLDSFLQADWSDPRNTYSYAAAWTFLKHYTGKDNPSLSDVTNLAREDFLDFLWDRYHKVVSDAIHKYDPNHMYWGSRAVTGSHIRAGFYSGAGRYVDAVCCNYYHDWTPDRAKTTRWNAWSYDKPYVITEWYAMGNDAHELLENSSGAGFVVNKQSDRGLFYQNFALKLMESKNCIGFHWFTYMDNDPTNPNPGDTSNVNSNKGLMSTFTYEPYEELTTEMAELNRQAYRVIDYFDK